MAALARLTLTLVVWESEPLVPVTVTVYDPALPVQNRVEGWDEPRVTLVGLREQVRPAEDTVRDKLTVPVNPFIGETVTVEVAPVPASAVTLVGLAVTLKSTKWKVIGPVERDTVGVPEAPVMVVV